MSRKEECKHYNRQNTDYNRYKHQEIVYAIAERRYNSLRLTHLRRFCYLLLFLRFPSPKLHRTLSSPTTTCTIPIIF